MTADVCPGAVVQHILLADMLRRGVKAVLQCGVFLSSYRECSPPNHLVWCGLQSVRGTFFAGLQHRHFCNLPPYYEHCRIQYNTM